MDSRRPADTFNDATDHYLAIANAIEEAEARLADEIKALRKERARLTHEIGKLRRISGAKEIIQLHEEQLAAVPRYPEGIAVLREQLETARLELLYTALCVLTDHEQ